MSSQYTIRSVPPEVDEALRRRAEREGKSLNTVALEILTEGLELGGSQVEYRDLDDLVGSWVEDAGFDEAVADFEKIDEATWK
jgi:plasmid stability protein